VKAAIQAWFADHGRRMGQIGGTNRAKTLSAARRREIASMGGKARAAKAKDAR
jgi:hypothetical protein